MDSVNKNTTRRGANELTPEVIESATLEIIHEAGEILKMYDIDGTVISVDLGLLPNNNSKRKRVEDEGYELSMIKNDNFGVAINYKHPKFKK